MWQTLLPIPLPNSLFLTPPFSLWNYFVWPYQGGVLLFLGPGQDCCLPHGPPQPPPIFSMLAPQTLVPGKRGGQERVQLCKHVHLHCCLSATIGISVGDSRVGDLHFTSLLQLWRFRCSKGLCPEDQNTYKLAIIPKNVVSC